MSLGKLTKGGFWTFLGTILFNLIGYLYLLTISKFVSPEIVGSVAVVISLQTMITGMINFGIPRGLQRFLGKCLGSNDHKRFGEYFMTTFLFALILNILCAIVVLLVDLADVQLLNLTYVQVAFVAILLFLAGWSTILQAVFYSTLQTAKIFLAMVASSIAKLAVGIMFLFIGFDFVGVMLGYFAGYLVIDVLLLFFVMRYLEEKDIKINRSMFVIKRPLLLETLRSGMSEWIPTSLRSIGEKAGVVGIYASVGGIGAGLYFMIFSLASIVITISSSMLTLLLPVLSSMIDGRKRVVTNAIRVNLAITSPIAFVLVLYPRVPLSFIGSEYIKASDQLAILAIAAIISPVVFGCINYIYAVGKNTHVLIIGLTFYGSQLILYAILIPSLGNIGASIAYTSGFFIALTAILPSIHKVGYKLNWNEILKVLSIPVSITILLYLIHVTWAIGIPLLLLGSLISYTRSGLITRSDSLEILKGFMSEKSISKVSSSARVLIKLMYRR
jgi:O-antigen/teichoic acid export membrane protein